MKQIVRKRLVKKLDIIKRVVFKLMNLIMLRLLVVTKKKKRMPRRKMAKRLTLPKNLHLLMLLQSQLLMLMLPQSQLLMLIRKSNQLRRQMMLLSLLLKLLKPKNLLFRKN